MEFETQDNPLQRSEADIDHVALKRRIRSVALGPYRYSRFE